eukprot:851536-Heterocapsa_arctica.AAC.1
MAMAGCYHTAPAGAGPDEEQVLFAPLGPLLQHLAEAETYVLRHCRGPTRFPDESVMGKLRAIDENIRAEWARLTRTTGETLGQACDSTHTYAAGLWMTEPIRPVGVGRVSSMQGKLVTYFTNANGKQLCKPWNDSRGWSNSQCTSAHACDAMLPTGKPCLRHHRRREHMRYTAPSRQRGQAEKATPSAIGTTATPPRRPTRGPPAKGSEAAGDPENEAAGDKEQEALSQVPSPAGGADEAPGNLIARRLTETCGEKEVAAAAETLRKAIDDHKKKKALKRALDQPDTEARLRPKARPTPSQAPPRVREAPAAANLRVALIELFAGMRGASRALELLQVTVVGTMAVECNTYLNAWAS